VLRGALGLAVKANAQMMLNGIEMPSQSRNRLGTLAFEQGTDERVVFRPGFMRRVIDKTAQILDTDELPRIDQVRIHDGLVSARAHDCAMHLVIAMYEGGLALAARKRSPGFQTPATISSRRRSRTLD
jgi:hypothetical protein